MEQRIYRETFYKAKTFLLTTLGYCSQLFNLHGEAVDGGIPVCNFKSQFSTKCFRTYLEHSDMSNQRATPPAQR